jgi:hypothetical protein
MILEYHLINIHNRRFMKSKRNWRRNLRKVDGQYSQEHSHLHLMHKIQLSLCNWNAITTQCRGKVLSECLV